MELVRNFCILGLLLKSTNFILVCNNDNLSRFGAKLKSIDVSGISHKDKFLNSLQSLKSMVDRLGKWSNDINVRASQPLKSIVLTDFFRSYYE